MNGSLIDDDKVEDPVRTGMSTDRVIGSNQCFSVVQRRCPCTRHPNSSSNSRTAARSYASPTSRCPAADEWGIPTTPAAVDFLFLNLLALAFSLLAAWFCSLRASSNSDRGSPVPSLFLPPPLETAIRLQIGRRFHHPAASEQQHPGRGTDCCDWGQDM